MLLNLLHINGKTYTLDMNDDATVQQTKIALVYLYKLPYQTLEFLINGRKLNDDEVVSQIEYLSGSYIIFYEPLPCEDIEGISPFFGSIPQVCNSNGAPPFNEKDDFRKNASQRNQESFNPFIEIENGSDRKYIKYIIEPTLIKESNNSSFDFNPISIDGNELKFNANKKQTQFEQLYKNDLDTLTKPVYPQAEIIKKAKTSVDYFYADAMQLARLHGNSVHQNQTNSTQSGNSRSFITNNNDGNLPTNNLNNMSNLSYMGSFNNNAINSRSDFNQSKYANQPLKQYPFR